MGCTIQATAIQCPAFTALAGLTIVVVRGRACETLVEKITGLSGLTESGMPLHQAALQINTIGHAGFAGVDTLSGICFRERCGRFREIDLEFGTDLKDLGKMI